MTLFFLNFAYHFIKEQFQVLFLTPIILILAFMTCHG